MMRLRLIITVTACFLVFSALTSLADNAVIADTLKSLEAYRITGEIKIDGFLDEPDWGKAEAATGFRQLDPKEGEPGTERTEAKILYGDNAIYIGVWCYDSEPDKIIQQLTRRDRFTDADNIAVRIDSYHDHQSALYFSLNASGVKRDILLFNSDRSDESWDAVWDGNVQLTSKGWTAEFKIPYTALRFVEQVEHTWGLDFSRYIPRKGETQRWQFVPSSENGGVPRYGHLTCLKGIHAPTRIETLPYFVSYGTHEPGSQGNPDGNSAFSNFGGDFKYSLSSSFNLDATVNPDFGQVEFDGATVNLGVFETWYPEKRPFFLEGTDIFQMPYFDQFYSRRIGGAPHGGAAEADSVDYVIDYPNNTTILGALKLSGRTLGGTSIGVLNATTQKERMTYRREGDSTGIYDKIVEPTANYSVARIKQELGNSSYIGGMFTGAIQNGRDNAYTGSIDWTIYNPSRQYKFEGMAVGNSNENGPIGGAYYVGLYKENGKFHRGNVLADYYSKNHYLNRLGSSYTANYWGVSSWHQFYTTKGWGPARYAQVNFNGHYNRLKSGERFSNGWNVNGHLTFKNNWGTGMGYSGTGSSYDPNETRGRGLWLRPGGHSLWLDAWTDPAKMVQIEYYIESWNSLDGEGNYHSIWMNFKPMDKLEFSVGTSLNRSNNQLYWTGVVGAATDLTQADRPVFGRLEREKISMNTRGLYSFTRDLTLQWAAEFYFDAGEFDDFQVLTDPKSLEDMSDGTTFERQRSDYNYKSLQANMVLRWEFRPGSALFVVWTHNRDEYATDHGDLDFSRDMGELFATPQTNSLLIKANYWWNL
jgi:hypothetical protein